MGGLQSLLELSFLQNVREHSLLRLWGTLFIVNWIFPNSLAVTSFEKNETKQNEYWGYLKCFFLCYWHDVGSDVVYREEQMIAGTCTVALL